MGEGAQGPRCASTEWRRGAFSGSYKVVAATTGTRAGSSWSRFFPRSNPVSVSYFLTQVHVVTASGCGRRCATPFFRRVRCRSGSQTKKQRLFPYCSLFSTCCVFFHATHFIASPRSIGRLPETVKYLTGSPLPLGMLLRSGPTVYFKEESEAAVYLFLQRTCGGLSGAHPRTSGSVPSSQYSTANGAAGHNRGEVAETPPLLFL